jgi:hypothetical protein
MLSVSVSRGLFVGAVLYVWSGASSLPPVYLLLRDPSGGRFPVALKIVGALWLSLALAVHLLLPLESDQTFGGLYRRDRAMYVYLMALLALMLCSPHWTLRWIDGPRDSGT